MITRLNSIQRNDVFVTNSVVSIVGDGDCLFVVLRLRALTPISDAQNLSFILKARFEHDVVVCVVPACACVRACACGYYKE